MSHTFKITVLLAALCVVTSAAAQTNPTTQTSEMTTTKTTKKSGVVETIYGNHVVLRDSAGTHEWTVPEDFKFQMSGQNLALADLRPGMKVEATTTKETTIKDVILTKNVTGQVVQVAPGTNGGGIVVRDPSGRMTSFSGRDLQGRDVTILRDRTELPWRPTVVPLTDLRVGDTLNASIVTTLPPQVVTKLSTTATVHPSQATGGAGPAEPAPTPAPQPAAK
jgi:hypothetical protein